MKKIMPSSGYGQSTHTQTRDNTSEHFAQHRDAFVTEEERRERTWVQLLPFVLPVLFFLFNMGMRRRQNRENDYRKRMHNLKQMKQAIPSSGVNSQFFAIRPFS
jgi:preprotein translocase subunit YajC